MADPTRLRLVLMSEELWLQLGASGVVWGRPVEFIQGRPVYVPTISGGPKATASARRQPVKERARKADHKHDYSVKLSDGWEACPRCWERRRVRA